ncbi:hypothetical protein PTSG_09943 [Salpingoeca rosetta]|uniref:Uncharacterized protein n=1 Tax=Salpingoeca rosetta (strain ATCC 50818 / BSB-021) TaxID=946362 RepID=F2UNL7_SALR5|nr:uncharacterized protein PTSG_09943 [Salpingoeca rosetta]EGD79222.1 hypothetical protein PTSG_09943 [Salpingoeca rosetta]|eukprot:XP_004989307.1 hypothetical protein PTSG_09943 [Salpingoeca rosetta]
MRIVEIGANFMSVILTHLLQLGVHPDMTFLQRQVAITENTKSEHVASLRVSRCPALHTAVLTTDVCCAFMVTKCSGANTVVFEGARLGAMEVTSCSVMLMRVTALDRLGSLVVRNCRQLSSLYCTRDPALRLCLTNLPQLRFARIPMLAFRLLPSAKPRLFASASSGGKRMRELRVLKCPSLPLLRLPPGDVSSISTCALDVVVSTAAVCTLAECCGQLELRGTAAATFAHDPHPLPAMAKVVLLGVHSDELTRTASLPRAVKRCDVVMRHGGFDPTALLFVADMPIRGDPGLSLPVVSGLDLLPHTTRVVVKECRVMGDIAASLSAKVVLRDCIGTATVMEARKVHVFGPRMPTLELHDVERVEMMGVDDLSVAETEDVVSMKLDDCEFEGFAELRGVRRLTLSRCMFYNVLSLPSFSYLRTVHCAGRECADNTSGAWPSVCFRNERAAVMRDALSDGGLALNEAEDGACPRFNVLFVRFDGV